MAINKVIINGETALDLTESTVTPETMAYGVKALDSTGTNITGTSIAQASGSIVSAFGESYGTIYYKVRDDVVTIYTDDEGVPSYRGFASNQWTLPDEINPGHPVYHSCMTIDSAGNEYSNGTEASILNSSNVLTLQGILTGTARFCFSYIRGVS